ncbi:MAG: hypothetical protein LBU89_12960 [Fibromonadaceae bacterium]|jgi:hypothetical protein|nr:hypothetical protein [Fibromonadaceae bacterium]
MMNKIKFILVAASVMFAMAFTFSCSAPYEDVPDGDGRGGISSSSGGGGGGNNTQEKAILVSIGYSATHTISSSGEHWFKFVGTGDPVIFETTGDVVDTGIDFYTESSYTDWSSVGGVGSNALLSRSSTVSGTTYFIRVKPHNGTSGTYTFIVTAPTTNIRTNPMPTTVGYSSAHTINSSGTHWFSFQGTGNSVVFETESNVANTSIDLFIGDNTKAILTDNNRIVFSTVSGTTYNIRITSRSGGANGTYTFSVRSGTGDGTSMSSARLVAVGYSSAHTISSSDEHWFSFLGTGDPVIFETTGDVVDTYMRLREEDGWQIAWDDNSGEGYNALINQSTTLGKTYFIQIEPGSGTSGTYTFVVR